MSYWNKDKKNSIPFKKRSNWNQSLLSKKAIKSEKKN